jgi:mRNA interferase RelE/StbE
MKVVLAEQVVDRLRTLHPDERRRVRQALRELADGRGDRRPLEGRLEGFYRLRVGRFRIVYAHKDDRIEALFLERRSIIYELFRP